MSGRRERLYAAIDRWMETSHPIRTDSLALFRILYALYLMLFGLPWAVWTAELPAFLWDPPDGPYELLGGFPSAGLLRGATLLVCVSTVALALGFRTRAASIATGVLMMVLVGFEFSTGKADHNRHLMMWLPLVLAFSPWGARYSVDAALARRPPPERAGWAVAWWALAIGIFFFNGGAAKVVGGWLWPSRHAVAHYAARWGVVPFEALPRAVWELADVATVVFETGFLLAITTLRGTRLFCALAVCFHVAILATVRIHFPEQIVAYGVFVEWSRRSSLRRAGEVLERGLAVIARRPEPVVLAAGLLLYAVHAAWGSPLSTSAGYSRAGTWLYWVPPLAISILWLAREALDVGRRVGGTRAPRTP